MDNNWGLTASEMINLLIEKLEGLEKEPESWNAVVKSNLIYGIKDSLSMACEIRSELKRLKDSI
jgi:hypothetical protein